MIPRMLREAILDQKTHVCVVDRVTYEDADGDGDIEKGDAFTGTYRCQELVVALLLNLCFGLQ